MKALIILIVFLFPLALVAQDCDSFKRGTFKFEAQDGSPLVGYRVKRKKNFQIESTGKLTSKWKIEWTSECTFVLTLLKSTDDRAEIGAEVKVKILTTDGNQSKILVTDIEGNNSLRLSMIKVK